MEEKSAGSNHDAALVQAENIGVRFGEQSALANTNLAIGCGEFVSLVGPSGCGKSTLLRLIAGLLSPTTGTLTLAGHSPQDPDSHRQRVAFVFQDATLLPWRTVEDNIRLPLELQRVSRESHRQPIADSLRLIGLNPADAGKFPRMLSGGMRMRVSLARALVTEPTLMLLDEPFAALDDILRQQLNEELVRIWRERKWTGIFVTHNVSEAVFLSQRVLVMSARPGTIVDEIRVPFSYPRLPELRADAEFARIAGEVSSSLRRGVQ